MMRRNPPLAVGTTIIAGVVAVALLASVLAPFSPGALVGSPLEQPSGRHWLGTNDLGQDLFSQLIWGARSSIIVAVAAALLVTAIGTTVGLTAGLVGGAVDMVTMRIVDILLALPGIPLIVVIAALAGPSRPVVIIVIGFIGWPLVARAVRSQALSLRQRGFVAASQGFGGGPLHLLRRHLVPGVGPVVVSLFLTWLPAAILLEAGLSFLGLGDPLGKSWGLMLNRALGYPGIYFTPLWIWWVLPAGFAISVTVLGFTFLGVGLETRLNPRATQSSHFSPKASAEKYVT